MAVEQRLIMKSQSISDYALIGNTRGAALVGKNGSIDWCCMPEFDSPAVFSLLIGDNGGFFAISLKKVSHGFRMRSV